MDHVYAFGITIIQPLQKTLLQYEDTLSAINNLADPNYAVSFVFPLVSVFDSVFASEFLLVFAAGGWLNAIFKWLLAEHRPYWWVKETRYYGPVRADRPILRLGPQTCETGPGCPSGHVTNVTSVCVLFCWWLTFALSRTRFKDRTFLVKILKWISWLASFIFIMSTCVARLYISTHFPHQCLLGIAFGSVVTYWVVKYWSARVVENATRESVKKNMLYNVSIVIGMVAISFAVYWGQKLFGVDPSWSVKLAFKRCPAPEFLHFNTTPFYSLVQATGCALGWALCATPALKRYFGRKRSFLIGGAAAALTQTLFSQWQGSISRDDAVYFYLINFAAYTLRVVFLLRVVPFVASVAQGDRKRD